MKEKRKEFQMPKNRLERSKKERMIGGVCGGLSKYLNVDVSIIRLLFVLSAFIFHLGAILFYVILLLIIPLEK
jgi:phage shock protein C